MTVRTALAQGTRILEDGAIHAPRLTAEVLLCHALRREKTYLFSHPEAELSEVAWIHYGRYLHERLSGKPTQYITRKQEFYGREFRVSPAVLIPRPETEHVVESALRHLRAGMRVLDVGCGSGAIAVTLALEAPGANVAGADISEAALAMARANARRLGGDVAFSAGDLLTAVRPHSLDMVVSNPPYVGEEESDKLQREVREWEPAVALYGGRKGIEIYQRLIPQAAEALRPAGWIVLEMGYDSLDAVRSLLDNRNWGPPRIEPDLSGIPRAIAAQRRGG